jgi:hypothetical protein
MIWMPYLFVFLLYVIACLHCSYAEVGNDSNTFVSSCYNHVRSIKFVLLKKLDVCKMLLRQVHWIPDIGGASRWGKRTSTFFCHWKKQWFGFFSAEDGKQAREEASEVTNLCPTDYYVSIVKKKRFSVPSSMQSFRHWHWLNCKSIRATGWVYYYYLLLGCPCWFLWYSRCIFSYLLIDTTGSNSTPVAPIKTYSLRFGKRSRLG